MVLAKLFLILIFIFVVNAFNGTFCNKHLKQSNFYGVPVPGKIEIPGLGKVDVRTLKINANPVKIPKGFSNIPSLAATIKNDAVFHPISVNAEGKPFIFADAEGQLPPTKLPVAIDANGIPVGVGKDGKPHVGFANINNLPTVSNPNAAIFDGKYDTNQTGKTLPSLPKHTKKNIAEIEVAPSSGMPPFLKPKKGVNLANLNKKDATGLLMVNAGLGQQIPKNQLMVPKMGVPIKKGSNKFFPVYVNPLGEASTYDNKGKKHDVEFNNVGAPITRNADNSPNFGFVVSGGNIKKAAKGQDFEKKPLNLGPISKNIELLGKTYPGFYTAHSFGNDTDINKGSDKNATIAVGRVWKNFIKNFPDPVAFDNLIDPVFNTTDNDMMIPDIGVSTNPTGQYRPVFMDKNGQPVTYDDSSNPLTVKMDAKQIPVVIRENGKQFPGFRMINNKMVKNTPTTEVSDVLLTVSDEVQRTNDLGKGYPGWWTIHRGKPPAPVLTTTLKPKPGSTTKKIVKTTTSIPPRRTTTTEDDYGDYDDSHTGTAKPTTVKITTTTTTASPSSTTTTPAEFGVGFNIGKMNLPQMTHVGRLNTNLSIEVPKGYVAVPDMGVEITNNQEYYCVVTDREGFLWTFDETGKKIEVYLDQEGIPAVYGETHSIIYQGYILNFGVYRESDADATKYNRTTINIQETLTKIETYGKECPFYYSVHYNETIYQHDEEEVEVVFGTGIIIQETNIQNVVGMYQITQLLERRVPKGYALLPRYGIRLTDEVNYYCVFFDSDGNVVTFDKFGVLWKVQFDTTNGAPIVKMGEVIYIGYVVQKTTNVVLYSSTTSTYTITKVDVNQVLTEIDNLSQSFPGYWLVHKITQEQDVELTTDEDVFGVGFDLATFDYKIAVGIDGITEGWKLNIPEGYIMVPDMGVSLTIQGSDQVVYYPVYINKYSFLYTFTVDYQPISILLCDNGAPVALGPNHVYWYGFVIKDGTKIYSTAQTKITIVNTINFDTIVSRIDSLGNKYPGYFTLHEIDKTNTETLNLEWGVPVDYSLMNMNKAIGLGKITGGLKNKYNGVVQCPYLGVKLSTDDTYYGVFADINGTCFSYNNDNTKFDIYFDDNQYPTAKATDGSFFGGYKEESGTYKYTNVQYSCTVQQVNVNEVASVITKTLKTYYPGYYSLYSFSSKSDLA
uniref:Cytochrome c domain-containing protein n=1 Tax=Rhabditophanes sp. KR3021 TaxID=114890 RepID=A0AC35UEP1_9BILA